MNDIAFILYVAGRPDAVERAMLLFTADYTYLFSNWSISSSLRSSAKSVLPAVEACIDNLEVGMFTNACLDYTTDESSNEEYICETYNLICFPLTWVEP